jgi:ATP phosphoribosyltransferase
MKKTDSKILTIAMSKGYLLTEAVKLFAQIGYEFNEDLNVSRKLFTTDKSNRIQLLQVRPWDVPAYIEQGAADLGIVGKDVLLEKEDDVVDLLDLKFGYCSLIIASLDKITPNQFNHNITVATKYTNSTKKYFQKLGVKAKIIKLYGAVELGPLTGLSDVICDLMATGKTLEENGLHVLDTVFASSAHLIANPVGLRFHYNEVVNLVNQLKVLLGK